MNIQPGDIITHPKCPEWGKGKVLTIAGDCVTIQFRNAGEKKINPIKIGIEFTPTQPSAPQTPPPRQTRASLDSPNSSNSSQSRNEKFSLGNCKVFHNGKEFNHYGVTVSNVESAATITRFKIRSDDYSLILGYFEWRNGEKDIQGVESHGPKILHRLEGRLRMSVFKSEDGNEFVELTQARIKQGDWANVYKPSYLELDKGANRAVSRQLLKLGALEVGSKSRFIKNCGNRQNYPCAKFPAGNHTVPVAAYIMTRILPLLNGIRA